jgi:hypothetical protein
VIVGEDPVYPGARPFGRADSGRFFGRTAEAARLVSEWLRNPLTYLTGSAGIGKTSLLVAGVLPLIVDPQRTTTLSLLPVGGVCGQPSDPGPDMARCPVAMLPAQHNPYSFALLRSWTGSGAATHLAGVPIDDFVRDYAGHHPEVVILAAIDQADDLFAGPAARQPLRRRFLEQLAAAMQEQPRLRLLISARSDCLGQFAEVLGTGVQFFLDPLRPASAHEAIAKPGFFAADAATELVRSIRTSRIVTSPGEERLVISDEVQPALLQVACAGLWESLRSQAQGNQVTLRELARHREVTVDSALSGYCSTAIAAVAAIHQIPVGWLRSWLIETFITEIGNLRTVPEGHPETAGTPTMAARAFEDRYLLRVDGARRYQLFSDRLVEPLRHTAKAETGSGDMSAGPGELRASSGGAGSKTTGPKTTGSSAASSDQVGSGQAGSWQAGSARGESGHRAKADLDEYLRAAERALTTGEHDLAAKLAAHVLSLAPQSDWRRHAEAHALLGDLAYEQGFLDKSDEAYRTAMLLFEGCGEHAAVGRLLAAVAQTLIGRDRLIDALDLLRAAISRVPDVAVRDSFFFVLQAVGQQAAQQSAQDPPGRTAP